ncbi:Carboxylesterase 4A [Colletotrichum chlorophyti]|uniref:Carboxylic ester hydrolase n=1 Tax=Colletotrichum chlorophyti TaxID=708187 RepID=A0A1Q8S1V2_9PEZI|nr:Carboxylesterase 4A [Colletotrichum chlorophyti]
MNAKLSAPLGAQRPRVRLEQGTYVGTKITKSNLPRAVEAFLGVPYATSERLRPAVHPPPSGETYEACEYGPACPTADPSVPADEKCLVANIFRPVSAAAVGKPRENEAAAGGVGGGDEERKLPVLVYVHGGAFNFGRGSDRNLAAFVAHSDRGLVAVSFNYRLGPLGFLPCEVAAAEGVSNLGLLDQRALLEWVRRNVGEFGGDAGDVTVTGFSAGAHSLGHHILSPPSRALFNRAIVESGAATARSVLSPSHPRHASQLSHFLSQASLSNLPPSGILPALRSLPVQTILDASLATWADCAPSVQWPFQPSIDTHSPTPVIPDLPLKTWSTPNLPPLPPLMTGFNTSEGTMFVPASSSHPSALKHFFSALIPSLSQADLGTLDSLYPPSSSYAPPPSPRHGPEFRRLAHAYGHYGYIAPLFYSAHQASKRGAPVWLYEYAAHADLGAANHGDHVPAATRDTDVLSSRRTPGLMEVSASMHAYWSSFVTANTPNGSANPSGVEWPRFVSPFGDDADGDRVPGPDDELGRILVFGEGNDELMGRLGEGKRGVVARVRTLTGEEVRQFRFWWDRVVLSEGMGLAEDGGTRL